MSAKQQRTVAKEGRIVTDKIARKDSPKKKKKKTWESPRLKSGRLFEANSLACGKSAPMGMSGMDQCHQIPTQS
jgi:hypothetical protein